MKYVLRNKQNGCYLQRPDLWVNGVDEAITFEDLVEAREYCQAHRLENVQPVQRFMPTLIALLRRAARPGAAIL